MPQKTLDMHSGEFRAIFVQEGGKLSYVRRIYIHKTHYRDFAPDGLLTHRLAEARASLVRKTVVPEIADDLDTCGLHISVA